MIKVAHIADVHIRNLKYHDVYRSVFSELYANLERDKPDYIVVCGDIAHTKTQISPEYVKLASEFFISLANIATTIVIPGNHDGLVKNTSRLDAISPIVENIENENLFFTRDSKIISFDDIEFYHLSIFDRENWPKAKKSKKVTVALYHGAINNVETDIGYTIAHGDDQLGIFNGFDYAMLGDIHKTNQSIDVEGTVRYPGSLITQNFGETNDKGYLWWEIDDKKNFDCKHIQLNNPKPFITIRLTPKGRIPRNTNIVHGARVRLVSEHHISLDAMRKAVDVIKMKYKPESVSYLNRSRSRMKQNLVDDEYSEKNLRDIAVQEELIREYLDEYELEDDVLDRVLSLNKDINALIEKTDDVARNVYWELDCIEYDNLFNYGEGNRINFENLNGLIGIFGKSFSGKSSIVDSMLYTLFNNTSKSVRKNRDMINQNKDYAKGRAILTINDEKYAIERTSKKYQKKLHGVVTEEASTDVQFYKVDVKHKKLPNSELNGESRNDTDKKIRHKIGNLEDFLATSFAAQFGSLTFIEQKSTERKKMLAKFLDLEFFEQKYAEANDASSDLRGALKLFEKKDYEALYSEIESSKKELKKRKFSTELLREELAEEIKGKKEKMLEIKAFIAEIPDELIKIEHLEEDLKEKKKEKNRQEVFRTSFVTELQQKEEMLAEIKEEVGNLDENDLVKSKMELDALRSRLGDKIEDEIHYSNLVDRIEEAEKNISEAPCHSEYSSCYLVEESHTFLKNLEDSLKVRDKLDKIRDEYRSINKEVAELEKLNIKEALESLTSLKSSLTSLEESEIPLLEARIEKTSILVSQLSAEINDLESKAENYYKNKEKIEILESKRQEFHLLEKDHKSLTKEHDKTLQNLQDIYSEEGYVKNKIENIIEERAELESMREEYAAYELYKKCMHSNGIPFDIIKRRLPVINAEISKILANVVEFEVFFEANDNKLEIYLKHPKHSARLIETGSGAEKTLAATAIRLALLSVSSLPKGDLFILDEPATELDHETKEGFLRILEMIKSYFSKVILISHLDPLKDVVDTEISIEKKNGYAHVEV